MPNVPCFKENPKTLEWELEEPTASTGPLAH